MADNTNLALTVEAWAAIVVERWERKIQQLGIYHTGKLINSFTHFVNTQANGNPDKIVFAFEYYGKFVDMGVGRGVKLGEVELSSRKAKPWYSKTFWSQLEKLKEIFMDKYLTKAQFTILTGVEMFDIEGQRISGGSHSGSGSHSTIDKVTGKKTISYNEFRRLRKQQGW